MLDKLDREERLQLMRFVCSFAWADLEVQEKERAFVRRMVEKMALNKDEKKQVEAWLAVPPRAEDVDPTKIPRAHRKLFLEAAKGIISADGKIDPDEQENLALLEALTR